MAGGALEARSAATGGGDQEQSCASWIPGCPLTSRHGTGVGRSAVCLRAWRRFRWACSAMMGAMLSITGIFGMAAYSVSKRLRELGIRIALGAQRQGSAAERRWGGAFRLLAFGSAAGLLLGVLATPGAGSTSCTRQRRAIRWCWLAWCWRCCCWGCWQRGSPRSARCRSIL